jgi:hypothetical protein
MEGNESPTPCAQIEDQQQRLHGDDLAAHIAAASLSKNLMKRCILSPSLFFCQSSAGLARGFCSFPHME